MAEIPKMRTIQQCADYLKEKDPEGCIGSWCIRKMVQENKIPTVKSGNRNLINLDVLMDYLSGNQREEGQANETL